MILDYGTTDLIKNEIKKKIYLIPNAKVKHVVGGFYKNDAINEIDI